MAEAVQEDIDRLVDHYLGIPAASTQSPMPPSENYIPGVQPQHTDSFTGRLFTSQKERQPGEYEYEEEEEEGDIEALVESVLRGEPHDEATAAAKAQWERRNERREEEGYPQEEQQCPPIRPFNGRRDRQPTRFTSLLPSGGGGGVDRQEHLFRRLMLWQERRDAKRLQAVYEALLQEQAACPFEPRESLTRGGSIDSNLSSCIKKVYGADVFLQRMREARERRLLLRRAEEEEARRYSDTSTWKPQMTVPQPFTLGRAPRSVAAAAKRRDTFKRYAASIRSKLQNEPSQIEGPSVPSGLFSVPSSGLLLSHVPPRAGLP
ncbi:hypothetical protein TraAM80_03575 [Trypanosoma rangeli]|uniref:Uncharacterized protein n=1 Tax=Trypanosoma rangeli TaxID=5698 RepID=A0A3R7KIF3_TRYRA|nr:uncharacterized protein TraAM80_03575 [Trypanosoma rangeli]RNF07088.1 hypothetical protein TraAM80_03575 [Trypanosoma rangeli]|eukprot:RNF07088.1 hypothetical protein TraAM80_03575 [Trypanosoma rangeli]